MQPLLSLLAPPRCLACGSGCAPDRPLCRRCGRWLDDASPPPATRLASLDAAWAAVPHEGAARDLVAALKFRALLPAARLIAERIAVRAPQALLDGVVVPVPPAVARLLRRGFDPAEEIAAELAVRAGLRRERCLTRAGGRRQVGRSRAERIGSPPRMRASASPAAVVLIDDVLTTGATLSACARALRAAGARRVVGLTFARSV